MRTVGSFGVNPGLGGTERNGAWGLAAPEVLTAGDQNLRELILEEFLATTANADSFPGHAPHIIHGLSGLDPASRLDVLDRALSGRCQTAGFYNAVLENDGSDDDNQRAVLGANRVHTCLALAACSVAAASSLGSGADNPTGA